LLLEEQVHREVKRLNLEVFGCQTTITAVWVTTPATLDLVGHPCYTSCYDSAARQGKDKAWGMEKESDWFRWIIMSKNGK